MILAQHAGLALQHERGGGRESLLAQHAGHLSLLLAWIAIFAVIVGRQKIKASGLKVTRVRPGLDTLVMAASFVVAAGADWLIVGEHAPSGWSQLLLLVLTMTQLFVAGLVLTRPSDLLVRGVGTACLVIALWWVLARSVAGPGSVLSMVDVLAFAARLATAGWAWLILSRASVLSN